MYLIEPGANPFAEGARLAEGALANFFAAHYPCDMGAAGINDAFSVETHFETIQDAIKYGGLSAEELLREFEASGQSAEAEWMRGYLSQFDLTSPTLAARIQQYESTHTPIGRFRDLTQESSPI